jgi:hypothetical protein
MAEGIKKAKAVENTAEMIKPNFVLVVNFCALNFEILPRISLPIMKAERKM